MMKNSIGRFNPRSVAVVALALAIVAGAAAAILMTAAAQNDAEAAVRAVLMQSATGFERGDLAMLNRVYSNDESVTIFEGGYANNGWADYRDKHLVPEMKEMKNIKYTLSDIRVRVSGKMAWATYKYALGADRKESRVDVNGLGTAILEERDGRWQIMHTHTSAPRRAPAAAAPSPTPKG